MVSKPPELSDAFVTLSPNGCKARYGVSYLQNICAQAGVGLVETRPDEDVLAVDCYVLFECAAVPVQVKCTSRVEVGENPPRWPVEERWLRTWSKHVHPVYFVLVVVDSDRPDWLQHHGKGTAHRAAAYWRRLRQEDQGSKSLTIPKRQRLRAETLATWHQELLAPYTPGRVA